MKVNIYGGQTTLLISLFQKKHIKKIISCLIIFTSISICYHYISYKTHTNEELYELYYEEPDILARGTDAEVGLFYKSISNIKAKEYQNAITHLRQLLDLNGRMHDHAQWYMVMCLLKTNADEDTINAYLCDIARKQGRYSKRAKKILYQKSTQQENNNTP